MLRYLIRTHRSLHTTVLCVIKEPERNDYMDSPVMEADWEE